MLSLPTWHSLFRCMTAEIAISSIPPPPPLHPTRCHPPNLIHTWTRTAEGTAENSALTSEMLRCAWPLHACLIDLVMWAKTSLSFSASSTSCWGKEEHVYEWAEGVQGLKPVQHCSHR